MEAKIRELARTDPTSMTQAYLERAIANQNALAHEMRMTAQVELQGLRTQILERDSHAQMAKNESKTALDAAFSAQERAIVKSEMSVAKQLDSHAALLASTAAGLNDKIDSMKERLVLLEGTGTGAHAASMSVQSMISIATAIIVGVGGLLLSLFKHSP